MSWLCCGSSQMSSNSFQNQMQHENQELGREQGNVGTPNNQARTFTFQELANATSNFSFECIVDVSSSGNVYRGKLDGTSEMVAVERMDANGSRGHREFVLEILMSSLLHHPNLITLIGFCAEGDERLLVHEYLPSGSLYHHLHNRSSEQSPLNWHTRMKVAVGIAKGLEYLHHTASPAVIYRNLKPSNVLLDDDFNAKLSDFGVSKLCPTGDRQRIFTEVKGTSGYIAPEYEQTGLLTVKADVYSFGVVLLELITGRKAVDITRGVKEQNLVSWANSILNQKEQNGAYHELADPLLHYRFSDIGLQRALSVVSMCLQDKETARPEMQEVVTILLQLL